MARTLFISAAVAAALVGLSDATFSVFSKGTAYAGASGATAYVAGQSVGASIITTTANQAGWSINGDGKIYKWAGSTPAIGKFSGTLTPTVLTTSAVSASSVYTAGSGNGLALSVNTDGSFYAYFAGTNQGAIVSVTNAAAPTVAGVYGCKVESGTAIATFATPTSTSAGTALAAGTANYATSGGLGQAPFDTTGSDTNCYTGSALAGLVVPKLASFACDGTTVTTGTPSCVALDNQAAGTANLYFIQSTSSTLAKAAVIATGASTAAYPTCTTGTFPLCTAGTGRAVAAGRAVKFTTGKFVYIDGATIRYIDTVTAANFGSNTGVTNAAGRLDRVTPSVNSGNCDSYVYAGATCSSSVTTVPVAVTAANSVYSGLAMSVVKNVKVVSHFISYSGTTVLYVDQNAAGTSGTTAATYALVRCTYTTAFTDSGSACSKVATYTVAAAATNFNVLAGTATTFTQDVFDTPALTSTGTGRYSVTTYGSFNTQVQYQIDVFGIGTISRTVSVQTPAPNCKRNGRKYCTKTVTQVAKSTTTNSTTGKTNSTSNTTGTTTTTGSASAPLLASAWAMVGVVAALIAA